ncbi:related to Trans-aconitate 3-methyltransferase [Saccharomycodes ludwigii]|uniref:Related to Trans-aconitate 3-methyltransferase n=1 Tax=Saccharomycodes ludwigii TaxID=36035 RepID=A0A376B2W2_9ASCO|nr:hypothetical protein SCDLUD_001677 [Saccharomycodes ludwigii]KAH3901893.1 hypothetical protein SCDLUD_001677 [Saccharomycodes ludwigii]SSD58991.1 related to Trans-aconitate 3-methyltransferase [Saccharomycodes ludwigii]
MSEFSSKTFNAKLYSVSRPNYPKSLYSYLLKYHQLKNTQRSSSPSFLIDVGCGPGTATLQMCQHFHTNFNSMLGVDTSEVMIKQAQNNNTQYPNLSFKVAGATALSKVVPLAHSVDMITAAQCAHWFLPFGDFLKEVKKCLRPRTGTLAIWGYIDPRFVDYPELDTLLYELDRAKNQFGPFWQEPGRQILRDLLDAQKINPDIFYDIQELKYTIQDYRRDISNPANHKNSPFVLTKEMSLLDFRNYIYTWSAAHKRQQVLGDTDQIVANFFDQIFHKVPSLTMNSRVKVLWNTVYKLARAK